MARKGPNLLSTYKGGRDNPVGPGSFRKCVQSSRLAVVLRDGGYAGKLIDWAANFGRWVPRIVERSKDAKVLPYRPGDGRSNVRFRSWASIRTISAI